MTKGKLFECLLKFLYQMNAAGIKLGLGCETEIMTPNDRAIPVLTLKFTAGTQNVEEGKPWKMYTISA